MASVTQTIPTLTGGLSQQPDELKIPGQVNEAKNVLPDVTQGLLKRPGSTLIASLSDYGTQNTNFASRYEGRWFSYYRDETEQYIGQVTRDGFVKMWRCSDGQQMTTSYTHDGSKSSDNSYKLFSHQSTQETYSSLLSMILHLLVAGTLLILIL